MRVFYLLGLSRALHALQGGPPLQASLRLLLSSLQDPVAKRAAAQGLRNLCLHCASQLGAQAVLQGGTIYTLVDELKVCSEFVSLGSAKCAMLQGGAKMCCDMCDLGGGSSDQKRGIAM